MKYLIITDAWEPQVNGVVRTYQNIIRCLENRGRIVHMIHPYSPGLKRVPLIGYKEIELAINPWRIKHHIMSAIQNKIKIHIATEGPLGVYAKRFLDSHCYTYTTSFHTLFPEYIQKRFGVPASWVYNYFRWFHSKSKKILVPTIDIRNHLYEKDMTHTTVWTRGVDARIFNPSRRRDRGSYLLCVSRLSKEKGLDDFCQLKGRKVLIGDGPYLKELKRKYPDVEFLGKIEGEELAGWIASANVFVFPSKTDTFGIVILESIACGTPVAAYEQPGPRAVIANNYNGYISNNLEKAVEMCYGINRNYVSDSSKSWTWDTATTQFIEALHE